MPQAYPSVRDLAVEHKHLCQNDLSDLATLTQLTALRLR